MRVWKILKLWRLRVVQVGQAMEIAQACVILHSSALFLNHYQFLFLLGPLGPSGLAL